MKAVSEMAATLVPLKSQDDAPITQDITITVARSTSLVVTDAATYAQAGERLKGYAELVKRIKAFFDDDIATVHRAHKSLCDKRKKALDAVEAEVARLKRSLGDYVARQEADRRRREAEAQAEARRLEDERIAREAAALETAGQPALAAQVIDEHLASPPPVVVLAPATPTMAGISTVERYEYRVINEALVPRDLCSPDPKKLRARVEALKGATRIPGVEVWRQDQVRVRA